MGRQPQSDTKRGGTAAIPSANVGFERALFKAANALRGWMDAAESKHVVLGLISLKDTLDAFEELPAKIESERADGADPEDPDEYRAHNIFWVPPAARRERMQSNARQPGIGQIVEEAMESVGRRQPFAQGGTSQGVHPAGTRLARAAAAGGGIL